jgi:hypothetical protein
LIFCKKNQKSNLPPSPSHLASFFSNRLKLHSHSSIKQTNRDEAQLIDNQFVTSVFGVENASSNG